MKTLDEFMIECSGTSHCLSTYAPLHAHPIQVRILHIYILILYSKKKNIYDFH